MTNLIINAGKQIKKNEMVNENNSSLLLAKTLYQTDMNDNQLICIIILITNYSNYLLISESLAPR